jgi:predicted ATPase
MKTIHEVTASNFLSFRNVTVRLNSLTVLVGPNGAGKTNFLRIFQFLGEVARRDLPPAIDQLGGVSQLRFRRDPPVPQIKLSLQGVITANASLSALDEYNLTFREARMRTSTSELARRLVDRAETIIIKRTRGRGRRITLKGRNISIAQLQEPGITQDGASERKISVQADSSGLNMIRKLGDEYGAHQVEALAQVFEGLRLFEVDVDRVRQPASASNPNKLADDAGNLAAHLLWLSKSHKNIFDQICDDVRYVLPSFLEFRFTNIGGSDSSIRLDFSERHLSGYTPLARASYGTIRAIALFTMLNDPNPPRLTCLEEVDHGLHPHALDRLVERLRDASRRTQVIVATHSPALVNRISEDEIVIFERNSDDGSTRIVDLAPADIAEMKRASGYGLGELWFSGSLGGTLD